MIADVLSRSVIAGLLDEVADALERRAGEDPDAAYALERLRAAVLEGQPEPAAGAGRRHGEAPAPLDEQAFFSRDAVVSLLQSALEERLESAHPDALVEDPVPATRRSARVPIPPVTDRRVRGGLAGGGRRLGGRFEGSDVRWIAHFGVAKALRGLRDRHPFNPGPAPPVELAERARLVIVGDWGSGLPRARRVAQLMREAIEAGVAESRQVHVIHLGDVYYSGHAWEYRKRFLPYWPVRPEESGTVFSWSLNGNHDMYSGGHGYFGTLLADPRFAHHAGSSWFSLENRHWRIAGLDTAWDEQALIHDPRRERGLADPQAARLEAWAGEDERPLWLLSHHQLFSSYETVGPFLRERLAPLLDAGRIRAWFWGHEHKCVVHEPFDGLAYGRCIGHGGVPVHQVGAPRVAPPAVRWVEHRAFDGWIEQWALFGFAIADVDGPDVHVAYRDENGAQPYQEAFSAH